MRFTERSKEEMTRRRTGLESLGFTVIGLEDDAVLIKGDICGGGGAVFVDFSHIDESCFVKYAIEQTYCQALKKGKRDVQLEMRLALGMKE
ncbi:MAG: hypothetical protein GY679_01845 [Mycoplasma sp.]|nr:hypothetical protein [Mycoplasma sp.]